ncbi:glycosyltransferase [Roseibium polysiphoniae]|uniref:Glycosyltransferase n=1 Tax=Roseibium polysiphoniae TaxID=2571221 RepID=A0ABR9CEV2_9HYPH|nr:glycosyltransferase [Roseibium polysiphoniae]MBD8878416.1 glycosyltransferase [Roseibium polysiphoniae]
MSDITRIEERAIFRVLHISADYPNPYRDRTTTAIERLVLGAAKDAEGDFGEHIVVSLKRTSLPWNTSFVDCGITGGVRLFSYRYFGLPMGLGLARAMRRVARKIAQTLEMEDWEPDLIHAHKFAFEGIAGLWLAEHYGASTGFFVSVRGESERNVLIYKPYYRWLMRRIAFRADKIYHVSAWFKPAFNKQVSLQAAKERLLPNIVGNTAPDLPAVPANDRFVTVFHLNLRKRKGLSGLLEGFAKFHKSHPEIGLDIIGPGDEKAISAVNDEIERFGLTGTVRLLGGMNGKTLFEHLPHYLALTMPSLQETFGMVYLEALFAGIPILYSRHTGIDGYLDEIEAGFAVEPGNAAEILAALEALYQKNTFYRRAISSSSKLLHDRFDPARIISGYQYDLEQVCRKYSLGNTGS